MRLLMILFLVYLTGCASVVSNRETFIKAEKFSPGGRAQILPNQDEPGSRVALSTNTDIFKYGYWDNYVWGMTNQSKFAATGWKYSLGARITTMLNLEYTHHSQHMLDQGFGPNSAFPVEDSLGLVFTLYRRDPGGPAILGDK